MPKRVSDRPPAYLGIDPGNSGAAAWVCGDLVETCTLAGTERELWDWLSGLPTCPTFAVIERVGGFVKGSGGNIGSAMFTFGKSAGLVQGFVIALKVPYELVHPVKWQRYLGVAPKGKDEAKAAHKRRLKARAEQLFPQARVTLATADALLLAEYGRRTKEARHAAAAGD